MGDETTTGPDSGKPDNSGTYVVCNGAKCKCDQSVSGTQADFEVLSQSTSYINDTDGAQKLVGNTMDLGIPFMVKASTFGQCKLQPTGSSYLPCIPAIVSWSDQYDSVVLDNTGKLLMKDSTASCAIGGTVSFATHGQEQGVSQADAEEAAAQPALTPVMSEEEVIALTLGTFAKGKDDKGASVKTVTTGDGKGEYYYNKLVIPFKVQEFSKSSPSQASKDAVNWAVFFKKSSEPISSYKQCGLYSDVGEEFIFPFKIEGDYVVEAYGSTKGPFFLKNKPSSAYKKIVLKDQTIDGLAVTVNGDIRERVRTTEIATVKTKSLFSDAEMTGIAGENSVGKIIWDVKATNRGKDVPVTYNENPLNSSELLVMPVKSKASVKVRATSSTGVTKELTYKVGANYVTAIESNKKTVSVWESGEVKERHEVTLKVSEFIIEPALSSELAAVKWTYFKEGEKPDKTNVIATGKETKRYLKKEGILMYEAFMFSPEGGEKPTTKRVEAVIPQITKAYWADSKGNKLSRSGFEQTVYLHIETIGLTGEKLKFNVWESDKYYSDFVKNAGTEIEITSNAGVINQEFKLPTSSYWEQEYYFTIENLDFKVLGTKQDSDSNDEFVLWKNHTSKKVDYLYVNNGKKITSLKIYETGSKLHTGVVKYGDTLTFKLTSRNRVDEDIEFEIWKDVGVDNYKEDGYESENTSNDVKFSETVKIKVDKEGNGTVDFKVPDNWKDYQGTAKAQFFFLKEGDKEYPQANYTKGLNTVAETTVENANRVFSLMMKVSDTLEFDAIAESASAVILGEELAGTEASGETCEPLVWGSKLTCTEREKVIEIAKNLGLPEEKNEGANWIMAVMALETGGTFDPSIRNSLGYTGLIQFGKAAAEELGTTRDKLQKMTVLEQLDYVEKYLKRYKSKLKTITDIYLSVLYPAASGHGEEKDYVVFDDSKKAYKANPTFFYEDDEVDKDSKGKIIKRHGKTGGKTYIWEVKMAIQGWHNRGLAKTNSCKKDVSTCEFGTSAGQSSNSKWHDPVDNPRINKYNYGGNVKPVSAVYGYGRRRANGTKKYHSGIDLFGLPGIDKTYACLDCVLHEVRFSASAGWIVRVKVKNVADLLEQEKLVNYTKAYTDELKGVDITESDSVYLIYMHLQKVSFTAADATSRKELKAGTVLGYVGVSGSIASGGRAPHLHFEVSKVLNPYGTGETNRTNGARFVKLNSYDTKDQDDAKKSPHIHKP